MTDVCIFVHEEGHLISKDPNENIVQWRANKTVVHTQKTTWAYPYIVAEVMSVPAWVFFKPYFHYRSRSGHHCKDPFHIHFLICSSHRWFLIYEFNANLSSLTQKVCKSSTKIYDQTFSNLWVLRNLVFSFLASELWSKSIALTINCSFSTAQATSTIDILERQLTAREIAPKFFTLVTESWKLVAKLATSTFHHNLTKRYSELKRFAKINPRQTSSLSLFPKCSTCISIDN